MRRMPKGTQPNQGGNDYFFEFKKLEKQYAKCVTNCKMNAKESMYI